MSSKPAPYFALTILVATLVLGELWAHPLPDSTSHSKSSAVVMVTVAYPDKDPSYLANSVVVELEKVLRDIPSTSSAEIAFSEGQATFLVHHGRSRDVNAVARDVEDCVETIKRSFAVDLKKEGVAINTTVTRALFYVNVRWTEDRQRPASPVEDPLMKLSSSIKQVRGVANGSVIGHSLGAMWLRLDFDRMQHWKLSANDVSQGMQTASMIGDLRLHPVHETHQGRDYIRKTATRHQKLEWYENIILKASPDGEIVRVKDIGEVKFGPFYSWNYTVDSHRIFHASVTIVVTVLPGTQAGTVIPELKQQLETINRELFASGLEFEISNKRPES